MYASGGNSKSDVLSLTPKVLCPCSKHKTTVSRGSPNPVESSECRPSDSSDIDVARHTPYDFIDHGACQLLPSEKNKSSRDLDTINGPSHRVFGLNPNEDVVERNKSFKMSGKENSSVNLNNAASYDDNNSKVKPSNFYQALNYNFGAMAHDDWLKGSTSQHRDFDNKRDKNSSNGSHATVKGSLFDNPDVSQKKRAMLSHKTYCILVRNPHLKKCMCFPLGEGEDKIYLTEEEYDAIHGLADVTANSNVRNESFAHTPLFGGQKPIHSRGNGVSGSSTPDHFWSAAGNQSNSSNKVDRHQKQLFRSSPANDNERILAQFTKLHLVEKKDSDKKCSICLVSLAEESDYEEPSDQKRGLVGCATLTECNHSFHTSCLKQLVSAGNKKEFLECPNCHTIHGKRTGIQPVGGKMNFKRSFFKLPGYKCDTIEIQYSFPQGKQGPEHPNPGRQYMLVGFPRIAYLPDNEEGRKVLKLLRIAFDRRLTFTVGVSSSNGMPDCVVWNDIHHKTATSHGAAHGYPDPTYLGNVTKELANVGVTENCKEFRDMGDPFPQQKRGYWNWY